MSKKTWLIGRPAGLARLCANPAAFVPWKKLHYSAAAYLVSRSGMRALLNESGWPDLTRLSAYLTSAVTSPIQPLELRMGSGKAGSVVADDINFRTLWPHVFTFTRPLFTTSSERSALQDGLLQQTLGDPTNNFTARFYGCGGGPLLPNQRCTPLATLQPASPKNVSVV